MKGVDPKVCRGATLESNQADSHVSLLVCLDALQFRRNQRWAQLGTQKAVAAARKEAKE